MASNLLAMASNLRAMASNRILKEKQNSPNIDSTCCVQLSNHDTQLQAQVDIKICDASTKSSKCNTAAMECREYLAQNRTSRKARNWSKCYSHHL